MEVAASSSLLRPRTPSNVMHFSPIKYCEQKTDRKLRVTHADTDLSDRGEDAALGPLVPIVESTTYQTYQPHRHCSRRHPEPYVHPRMRLNPDQQRQRHQLPY
ncbi:hypothetical protein MLD38_022841 [Melastoma candidum]|uniref:Uncharacterized protein n=1 Tax=Melastoma candidum TaxID=119954 RepID=A0ACB9QKM0_9MYRT|nr:hypothetical protein MLD38_022841 [Melastoma candidum]